MAMLVQAYQHVHERSGSIVCFAALAVICYIPPPLGAVFLPCTCYIVSSGARTVVSW